MDSDKAGILAPDTVIEALEVQQIQNGGGTTTRVRYSEGWVSEVTGGGITVLELVAEPAAEGAAPTAEEGTPPEA